MPGVSGVSNWTIDRNRGLVALLGYLAARGGGWGYVDPLEKIRTTWRNGFGPLGRLSAS